MQMPDRTQSADTHFLFIVLFCVCVRACVHARAHTCVPMCLGAGAGVGACACVLPSACISIACLIEKRILPKILVALFCDLS